MLTGFYIASNYAYDDGCIVGVGWIVKGISIFILHEMTPNTRFKIYLLIISHSIAHDNDLIYIVHHTLII